MAQQKYEIIERIGRGGMAEVFKASATSLEGFQKLVAIKRILPSLTEDDRFVQMFLDEAKVALPLNHTNIVQTFDLGRADETYFIVMEYVDGTDLESIVESLDRRDTHLDVVEAAFVGLEVCKGLVHAHRQTDATGTPLNIVHRDVSPPNILVSRDGEVKITDFGLAKARSQVDLTDPGVVKGKFGYLSPEAADGDEVDARTDLFAVGIVLWEMLTGERLFLGENDYETLQQVRQTEVPSFEATGRIDVPDSMAEIVYRALERDPDERYQTARVLGRDLAEFLYEYGEVMTSFDLANRVDRVLDDRTPEAETSLESVDRVVQREINQFVSLEDIAELDQRMADRGTIDEGSDPIEGDPEDFEDPRSWSDVEFDDVTGEAAPDELPSHSSAEDAWREEGLSQVAAVTRSTEDIEARGDEEASSEERGDRGVAAAPSETSDDADNETHADGERSTVLIGVLAVLVGLCILLAGAIWLLT